MNVKWEPFCYLQSEHIPSKWENTRSNMQVLTKIQNPTIGIMVYTCVDKKICKKGYFCERTHFALGVIRRNCTSNQNWACFLHNLKIVNTVLKNNTAPWSKLSEKLQRNIKILVGQTVLELLIKTRSIFVWGAVPP